MWECLADAYLNRGSLTASLKSFNKAIELNPESTYASYQLAIFI
jgi:cytochrome c-type biogenesis protein CcmH/NrfG